MAVIDGEQFKCSKHGIDYRICCEDCSEKWEFFKNSLKVNEEIKDDLVRQEVDDSKEDYFKGSKEDINEII